MEAENDLNGDRRIEIIDNFNLLRKDIFGLGTLSDKLHHITEGVVNLFDADAARIWVVHPGDLCDKECIHTAASEKPSVCQVHKQCLHLVAGSGRHTLGDSFHKRIPFGHSLIGGIVSGNAAKFLTNHATSDLMTHDQEWAKSHEFTSFAGYQLLSGDKLPIGVLGCYSRHTINPDEEALLEGLSIMAAQVIQIETIMETLRESQKNLQAFLNAFPDVAFFMDVQGSIIASNEITAERANKRLNEIIGTNAYELLPIHSADYAKKMSEKVVQSGQPITFEDKRDGRFFQDSMYPVFDANENVERLAVFSVDITERVSTEANLRESRENYRDLFENVSDFLYSHDLQGNLIEANLAFRTAFGFTEKDVKHRNIRDIMPERYRKEFNDYMSDILRHEKNEGILSVVAKDGSERMVEYRNSIISGPNGPVGVRGSARDITDNIKDKRELVKSEERFQQVVENAQEWIWEMDVSGLYTYANPVVENIIGYKPSEIAGNKYFYDFFLPEEKQDFLQFAFRSFEKKQSFRDRIYRNIHKNGEILWLQTSGVPILDTQGNLLGYRGATADITKQKKTESELMRLSYFDGLTGIANRRYFEDIAKREWRRALREESPLSLLMGDIDFFKNYNDTYGHLEGDECLRKVATVLKENLKRPGDMIARFGGEEFVILLPDTDAKNAGIVAEILRSRVENLGVDHIDSYISDVVTISVGVASVLPAEDISLSILIASSDRALYRAKKAGRNRVGTVDLMASST